MKTKIVLGTFAMCSSFAWAAPSSFNFSGTLIDPTNSNTPLQDPNAQLQLDVYSPDGSCLLYSERQSVNTQTTNGEFTLLVGSDPGATKRTSGIDHNLAWAAIFQSSGSVWTCYTAAIGDGPRQLKVTVTPSVGTNAGVATVLSPGFPIAAVPMANVADTLSPNSTINGGLTLSGGGNLNMANGGQTVGFHAPTGVSTAYSLAMPQSLPTSNNQVLTGDTGGNLTWTTPVTPTTMLDGISSSSGSMMYRGPSSWQSIPAGATTGQVLTWMGSNPSWQPAPTTTAVQLAGLGAFLNGGNSFGAPEQIGSTDTQPVNVIAGGVTAITVNPGGNVGIGTTAPAAPLDVNGNATFRTNVSVMGSVTAGTFKTTSIGTSNAPVFAPSSDQTTGIFFPTTGAIGFANEGNQYVMIDHNGNVGIGTTIPFAALDVESPQSANPVAYFYNPMTNPTNPIVEVQGASNTMPLVYISNTDSLSSANGPALQIGQNGSPIRTVKFMTITGVSPSCSGAVAAGSAFSCTYSSGGFAMPSGASAAFYQCYANSTPSFTATGYGGPGTSGFSIAGVGIVAGTISGSTMMFCKVDVF